MRSIFIGLLFFGVTFVAKPENSTLLLIEVSATDLRIEGKVINDLVATLESMEECLKVHFLVDGDVEASRIIELLNVAKKANCENVSVQSLPST